MMGVGRGFSKDIYTADPRSRVTGARWLPPARKVSEVFSACPKPLNRNIYIINEQSN